MTFRFDSVNKSLTVGEILKKDPTGHYAYNNDLDPETEVSMDLGGYAIRLQGYYTLGELLEVVKSLRNLNDLL